MARLTMTEAEYQAFMYRTKAEIKPVRMSSPVKNRVSGPNKTELRFALDKLDVWVHEGRICWYRWEPCAWKIILDHGQAHTYRPDFMACDADGRTYVFEIKGARIWDGAKDKFLRARREFPFWRWEAWQWKGGEWMEIWVERQGM